MTSNAVAPRFGGGVGLVSRDALKGALNNAAMTMPRVGGDKQFLKLDKGNGDWLFGQEETVVEDDSLWAVNPASLEHGYILWDTNGGGAPKQEIMISISRPLPSVDSLPEPGMSSPDAKGNVTPLEYQFQMSVDLVCIKGEDEGVTVQYKQSSVGAMKAFRALSDAIGAQLEADKDEIVPVVQMKSESYKHKKYGKIFNPVFEIVEWRSMDDTSPAGETSGEEVEVEAPTRQRRAAAPEPDTSSEVEEAELAKEYAAQQAAQAETPRRRVRR